MLQKWIYNITNDVKKTDGKYFYRKRISFKNSLFLFLSLSIVLFFIFLIKTKPKYIQEEPIKFNVNLKETERYFLLTEEVSENDIEFNYDYEQLKIKFNIQNKYLFGSPFIASDYDFQHVFKNLSDFQWTNSTAQTWKNAIPTKSIKCGDIVFVKTDYIMKFFKFYHPKINFPYILITHQSAFSVGTPEQLKYLDDPKIILWFAQNIKAKHPKLKPLPLGVVAPRGDNFETLTIIAQQPLPYYSRKNLLYLNFSPKTNKNRKTAKNFFQNIFKNNSNVLIVDGRIKWRKYLENIVNSQFVLSPPGAGTDCLRTWESLIMGSVPIVLKSELLPLYENMPVMVVNDWNEVTEESMKKFQNEKLINFGKDNIPWRPKLWLRYWINEIMSVKQNYILNYC